MYDCAVVCDGMAMLDCAGTCDDDPSNDALFDCEGTCEGTADCGPTSGCDLVIPDGYDTSIHLMDGNVFYNTNVSHGHLFSRLQVFPIYIKPIYIRV